MQSLTAEPRRNLLRERFKVRKSAVKCAELRVVSEWSVFIFPSHLSLILQTRFFSAGAELNAAAAPPYHLQLSLCRAACAAALSAPETTQQLSMTCFFWGVFLVFFFHLIPEIGVSSSDSK